MSPPGSTTAARNRDLCAAGADRAASVAFFTRAIRAVAPLKPKNVLVHCNQGLSRSPSIALLYLLKHTDALGSQDPAAALLAFRRLYPPYAPAQGMADYVRLNWAKYLQDG